uniref:Uncharacterized protein n=1 Tax=Tetraselmis sp. GSL018 TaxID=582737 RepID=A0A061QY82_9CHLO|eukprot:CAMPEP_0177603720 /NCGR_PEP_ID=MMETSP0419_2-20121207/15681_1 /TAXON_ID=582737 /ORGANISM="Tetraselmis sp., Strain GSL018" /LENGTH=198 /DNA_ID=CAMNT_0019097547 /DNA_START=188 /DNA_END=784 /DNA_ORIENTATION=+
MEDPPRREADYDRIGAAFGILSEEAPLIPNRRPANALPDIDGLHEAINELRQESQRNFADQRRNSERLERNSEQLQRNLEQLQRNSERLQRNLEQLQQTTDGINDTVARLEAKIDRTDVLASVRARNASADWSRSIAFPPNMAGDELPRELAAISGFQLSQLDARQLNQYVRFYGLRGRTRLQKLEELCLFLGFPSRS